MLNLNHYYNSTIKKQFRTYKKFVLFPKKYLKGDFISFSSARRVFYQTRNEIPKKTIENLSNMLKKHNGEYRFAFNNLLVDLKINDFESVNTNKVPINYTVSSVDGQILGKGLISNKYGFLPSKIINYYLLDNQYSILNALEEKFYRLLNIKHGSFHAYMDRKYSVMHDYINDNKDKISEITRLEGLTIQRDYEITYKTYHLQALHSVKNLINALDKEFNT